MESTCSSAPGDTLVFENDRVRVWPMTLDPDGMFDFHQHHHDHVILGRGSFVDGISEGQQ